MIKSANGIRKILSPFLVEPEKLEALLVKLEAQEKKTKAAQKTLQESKSKKKFLEEIEAKVETAQKELVDLEYKADVILSDARKKASAMTEEALLLEDSVVESSKALAEKEKQVKEVAKQLEKDKKKVNTLLTQAEASKVKYKELQKEYEDKLEDLKTRFSGLM
jgi:chromosome segregation ATPase